MRTLFFLRGLPTAARVLGLAGVFSLCLVAGSTAQSVGDWEIHDRERPQPPVVTPGTFSTQEQAGRPPSDAVVLFDGSDLAQWEAVAGGPAPWTVEDDYMQVEIGEGSIQTRQGFGDVQLHLEWATPAPARGQDQSRGNSGVFLMGRYEVQVLDSYQSQTYPDGQASAVYGQYPPLVNATRPPGQWQTYDIIFRRPRFDEHQQLVRPARVTVFLNGVLVQDNVELTGPTGHYERPPYTYHPDRLPLQLQDHNDSAVRYRNIWVRELE